jgi:hypothetical protein
MNGYPTMHSIGNMFGADDPIRAHFDQARRAISDEALGLPRDETFDAEIDRIHAALGVVNNAENRVRDEHHSGARVLGCTVLNGTVRNTEAERLIGLWDAGEVQSSGAGPMMLRLADAPRAAIFTSGVITHVRPDGTPDEFNDMYFGRVAGDASYHLPDGQAPVILIPRHRLERPGDK